MIRKLTVTNYRGETLELDLARPELSGFAIKDITGLGAADADIRSTDPITTDGVIFNSAVLKQRDIKFKFLFIKTDTESIEQVRLKSYKYFSAKHKCTLGVVTDTRTLYIDGIIEKNEPTIFSETSGCSIQLMCPFPYFYSKGTDTTVFSGVEPNFEFPFSNESLTEDVIEVGLIRRLYENVVTYSGDGTVGITIYIHSLGTVGDITIYNVNTRELMRINKDRLAALTGSGLVAKDDLVITTSHGEKGIKLIRDGVSYNVLNCLEKGCDWFTLSKGDNIFAFRASEGSANLQFRIENRINYEGV